MISLAAALCAAAARPPLHYLHNRFGAENESEEVRSAAIKRLLEVFGMEDPPAVHGHKQAPQYMLDLYNTVADVDGVTKDPYLLEGNTVRSFFDKRKIRCVHVRAFVGGLHGQKGSQWRRLGSLMVWFFRCSAQ